MKKESLFKFFRIIYLIWTIIYAGTILTYTFDPVTRVIDMENGYKPQIIDYINIIFLVFGLYYMFKCYSKKE